jgi:O-antigen ligase
VPALQKRARFIVLTAIALMVLLIVPTFNDSTNIPKYSVLFFAAALGASVLSIPKFGLLEKKNWKTWAPPVFFLSIMLIMALITDLKYTAFFGNYGRNNGWFQYLGLTALFLLTAFSFNFVTLTKLYNLLAALGILVAFYGYLQYQGIDFLDYADTGLPVIATLGNSNFASSFMGFAAIALLWKITDIKSIALKVVLAIIWVGQTYVIYVSQSSQGLFILLIGGLTFIGIKYFTSTKKIGVTYFSLFGAASFLGLLGLFQIGPLTKFVYQASTTYRGDYYRAAWRMFKEHVITGVGIDRYGEYYRTFRDVDAALRLGPSSVANYAHNAFLQLLATGGIILFLAYLVMIVFVALAAVKGLKKFKGNDKALFGALVSLWFAFQVQAQVSIDQITIAAIGWVLAGAVVALGFNSELIADKAFQPNTYAKKRRGPAANSTLVAGGLTLVLVITSFAWLVPIWRADYNIKVARILQGDPGDFNYLAEKKRVALSAVSSAPGEIRYKIIAADALVSSQELELARQQLKDALDMDPKSYEAIGYAAQVYERADLIDEAIKIRIVATNMDPNDTDNWLQLGKLLARVGDYQAVNKVIELVAPLAGKSTIANDLKALLPAVPTS